MSSEDEDRARAYDIVWRGLRGQEGESLGDVAGRVAIEEAFTPPDGGSAERALAANLILGARASGSTAEAWNAIYKAAHLFRVRAVKP